MITHYQEIFRNYLNQQEFSKKPKGLYEPVSYIMQLGGKRLRPVFTLLGCELYGGKAEEALSAAMAVEVFHNFTLVHDDIMDDAPLRRNQATVHEKWDVNTGILSGDVMLIQSYKYLEKYPPDILMSLLRVFNDTAIKVCEGQQYDVEFETRNDVSLQEYLHMIGCKTSVLIAAALQMGAIVAGANEDQQQALYNFGKNLGIAFQLQDDYLDAFGNPETFGKQVGGDIIENKKTYMYLLALKQSNLEQREALIYHFNSHPEDTQSKVVSVKNLFEATGAANEILNAVALYTEKALDYLNECNGKEEIKFLLKSFGKEMMTREV